MQPVDRLYGCRRVEKRRVGERPLGDVDQQAQSVGDVLVERALQAEHDRVARSRAGRGSCSPSTRSSGAPDATNSPNAGIRCRMQSASRAAWTSRSNSTWQSTPDEARRDRRRSAARLVGPGVLRVQQAPRVLPDQLDQGGHPQRPADVIDVEHQHGDRDDDQHERDDDRQARHLAGAGRADDRLAASPASRTRTCRRRCRSRTGSACPSGSAARSAARTAPSPAGRRPS